LYRLKQQTLVFLPDSVKESLRRLKSKQSRHWDEIATVVLLSIYKKTVFEMKKPLTTDEIANRHNKEMLLARLGQTSSVSSASRFTESARLKI
jgi:hypothetical protein